MPTVGSDGYAQGDLFFKLHYLADYGVIDTEKLCRWKVIIEMCRSTGFSNAHRHAFDQIEVAKSRPRGVYTTPLHTSSLSRMMAGGRENAVATGRGAAARLILPFRSNERSR